MKRKEDKEDFFGGFEAVVDGLSRIERVKPGSSKDPDDDGFETITEIGNEVDELPLTEPEEITGVKSTKTKEDGQEEEREEEEVLEEVEDLESTTAAPAASDNVSDLGEYETDVVDFFTDRFANELGWEIDEKAKPKTVAEVVEYLKNIVEESSRPQYANDEIEKLNEYVANGGDLKKFYNEVYSTVDLDNADLNNESVQKRILKENFERLGYSTDKINKFISRYEDSGTLQEEAEDALELLKEHTNKKAERLLADQQKEQQERTKQQQNFYNNVYTTIEKTDSILGIPISAKEKKELRDYIFKPEADGLTKYQKDYAKDNKNLIESAYITMKGNTLIQKVTQKATSQAAKNLQDKLANKGKRVKNSSVTHGSSSDTLGAWSTVSRQLRRPNF